LKASKKRIYISLVKALGLYDNLYWQASSNYESVDIGRELSLIARRVHVAPDLTAVASINLDLATRRAAGPLRLIFLSRISPMKNLDFLLRVLRYVSADVQLAIFGPREDQNYWEQCSFLIDQLPKNIKVTVGAQVLPENVRDTFAKYDLFVFPTRGENFGHVVFESLSVGTPVLVSDQTPWIPHIQGGLKSFPLRESNWINAIEDSARLDELSLFKMRQAASAYARRYVKSNLSLELNRKLFRAAALRN
jgi:glycosyltransferase involved in cell wall biosynthesis